MSANGLLVLAAGTCKTVMTRFSFGLTMKVTRFEQKSNTVGVMADVGGKGFNAPSRFTFVLDGDKVREMRITAD